VYWAVDPATGTVAWQTAIGPAGNGGNGGIEYGTATDGRRIYAAEGDPARIPYTLGGSGPYAGKVVTGGSWAALDPATGKILWQTPDPHGDFDTSYVTAANGVIYAGSLAAAGTDMYALDAATGTILWSFASGGSVTGGAAIADGSVYWGSGYCGTACLGSAPGDQQQQGLRVQPGPVTADEEVKPPSVRGKELNYPERTVVLRSAGRSADQASAITALRAAVAARSRFPGLADHRDPVTAFHRPGGKSEGGPARCGSGRSVPSGWPGPARTRRLSPSGHRAGVAARGALPGLARTKPDGSHRWPFGKSSMPNGPWRYGPGPSVFARGGPGAAGVSDQALARAGLWSWRNGP
jgi:hypothetical protein